MIKKDKFFFKRLIIFIHIAFFSTKYLFSKNIVKFNSLINKEINQTLPEYFSASALIRYCLFFFKITNMKSCFMRSLVIREILGRCGITSKIEIGISKSSGSFESHCWVKYENYYTERADIRRKFKILESN